MAKKTGDKKAGSSLGISIFAIVAVLVLLAVGVAYFATLMFGDSPARQRAVEDLRRSFSAHNLLQQQRFRQLEQTAQVVLIQERLTGQLVDLLRREAADRDLGPVRSRFEEDQNRFGHDATLLLDRDGRLVLRSDAAEAGGAALEPNALSGSPLLAKVKEDKRANGILALGDQIYQVEAVLLARDFDLAGYLVLALRFDQNLASDVRRASGHEIVFLRQTPTGPEILAGTLDAGLRPELVPDLRRQGNLIQRVLSGGQTVDRVDQELGGRPWIAFVAPLRDASEQPVGAMVAMVSLEDRLRGFARTRLALLAAAGVALVLGLAGSLVVGRQALRPVSLVTAAVREASQGRLDRPMPIDRAGNLRPLAVAADQLVSGVRERHELGSLVADLARYLPEPARTDPNERPRAAEMAILVVEMRRFANPKIGFDPEEHLGRYSHDLRRIASTVAARGGSVAALLGHRLMATFEGDDRVLRALATATEVLLLLSTRENAFDEPVPPAVALTRGSVALATLAWSGRSATAVAGLGVQQLESLMREAAPGEIYLSREIHRDLAEVCQRAGVEIRSQRGLVSPMPLFVLDIATARRLTGVEPPKPSTSLLSEDSRGLGEVVPGVELGGRYEVLAEIGEGPNGRVFKVAAQGGTEILRLKILRPEWSAPERLDRLRAAQRQIQGVDHPGIVSRIDHGQGQGLKWVATPFETGLTLRQALELRPRQPARVAVLVGRQLCHLLAAVHRQGLAHGGIKPENVLLLPGGTLRLLDLGFALPVDAAGEGQTRAGSPYLSPELLAGREPERRSDVFGVGVVLFEMVTGAPPYPGTSPQAVRSRQAQGAPSVGAQAEVPPRLEQALLRCLDPAPDRRFGTVEELLVALDSMPR